MIIGTAGHIDHGKTSLVHALTGVDTDRLPEEKRRGITIELGFAPLKLPGVGLVGVVDVPGHEAFIRTMVAGATGIDVGLVVIAADEGIMPQTREHLGILALLGVTQIVVALTKVDLCDDDWLLLMREEVREHLATTPWPESPIIETSVSAGRGLEEMRRALAQALKGTAARDANDVFRLPVDRVFSVKGTGTVVTGTSWSGRVAAGDELLVQPAGRRVRVRGIQVHGQEPSEAGPGSRVALAIVGAEVADLPRGSVLTGDDGWESASRFHAAVTLAPGAGPFRPREWLQLHVATSEVSARVVPVRANGDVTLARVSTRTPVVLRAGDRFVLRRGQPFATVGGGVVLDPAPQQRRQRPTQGWQSDPLARIQSLLLGAGLSGVHKQAVTIRAGVRPSAVRNAVKSEAAVQIGEILLHRATFDDAAQVIESEVLRHHDLQPFSEGLPLSVLRALPGRGAIADAVVSNLATLGRLQVVQGTVSRQGWRRQVSPDSEEAQRDVLHALVTAGLEPPSVDELNQSLGRDVWPVLKALEKEQKVVGVERDRYYEAAALDAGIARLRDAMAGGAEKSPSELRQVLGVSRKFLVPLLEYCDRRRLTERRADGRVWIGRSGA